MQKRGAHCSIQIVTKGEEHIHWRWPMRWFCSTSFLCISSKLIFSLYFHGGQIQASSVYWSTSKGASSVYWSTSKGGKSPNKRLTVGETQERNSAGWTKIDCRAKVVSSICSYLIYAKIRTPLNFWLEIRSRCRWGREWITHTHSHPQLIHPQMSGIIAQWVWKIQWVGHRSASGWVEMDPTSRVGS